MRNPSHRFRSVLQTLAAIATVAVASLWATAEDEKPGGTPSSAEHPTFRHDVLPILTRAGCAAGSCHAKTEGQNGFQLAVFSYNPASDYRELVHDARGRRVFPAAAEESLFLLKATNAIDHEGGKRIEPDSEFYQTLVRWVEQGMVYEGETEAPLASVHVSPADGTFPKGTTRQLKVEARYADSSTRDVTHLTEFTSHDTAAAEVDEEGVVQVGMVAGSAVVTVRYLDLVAVARITIPPDTILPSERYTALPVRNEIDRLAYQRHEKLGLLPSATCTDSEFIRRASLDAIGRLPTIEEAQAFLADKAADKRTKLIDRLLADDVAWSDYWATKFNDLLRSNTQRVGIKPVYLMDQWVRQRLRENTPWDAFVGEMLTAEGSTHEYGPVALMRDKREPADFAEFTSRIFLGVRIECAKCHHHPSEKWGQDDYYSLAAFFRSLKRKGQGISAPISGEKEIWWFQPGGEVKHPVSQEVMIPTVLDGAEHPDIPTETDPRSVLVEWMTAKDNPYFAKAIVNRVWGELFGRGIVHPVDDFRDSNPASNPALLDWLAADFVAQGFDLRKLVRTIMQSNLYQLSSLPNETNVADTRNFSRSYRRRLPAEVLSDAVTNLVADAGSVSFSGLPKGSPAMRTWNNLLPSDFLDAFGRPDSSAECPCERDRSASAVQALHLMNGRDLNKRLASASAWPTQLAKAAVTGEGDKQTVDTAKIIEQIYFATYARPPAKDELEIARAHFEREGVEAAEAAQDLLWSLINTAEFVFNH